MGVTNPFFAFSLLYNTKAALSRESKKCIKKAKEMWLRTMFAPTRYESFDKTFSKVFRAPAAKRRSPPAGGEIPQSAFLFCELFSLRLWCQREKWLRKLGCLRVGEHSLPLPKIGEAGDQTSRKHGDRRFVDFYCSTMFRFSSYRKCSSKIHSPCSLSL